PLARVIDERVPLRADVVAGVEQAHPHTADAAGVGIEAPQRTAALTAEALRPAVPRCVGADELLAREQPERAGRDPRLRRRGRPRPALAPRAVAVARAQRPLGHLEAHTAAHAVTGVRGPRHRLHDNRVVRTTAKVDYAVRAAVELAVSDGSPVPAERIAD